MIDTIAYPLLTLCAALTVAAILIARRRVTTMRTTMRIALELAQQQSGAVSFASLDDEADAKRAALESALALHKWIALVCDPSHQFDALRAPLQSIRDDLEDVFQKLEPNQREYIEKLARLGRATFVKCDVCPAICSTWARCHCEALEP